MRLTEKTNLGRGLSALLGAAPVSLEQKPDEGVQYLSLSSLIANENQPRKHFDEEALQQLADSIAKKGLISPIVVRRVNNGKYEIVAGERRFRAAQIARCEQVPVIIREDLKEDGVFELALIENLQRQDLNIIEEATAYAHLINKYSYTQEAIAHIVGKSRSHITNILRVLGLPDSVLELLNKGAISMGHAKVLLGIAQPEQMAAKVVEQDLSVRQLERIIKGSSTQPRATNKVKEDIADDLKSLEKLLSLGLNVPVSIKATGPDSGTVTISYSSLEQLDTIMQVLSSKAETKSF